MRRLTWVVAAVGLATMVVAAQGASAKQKIRMLSWEGTYMKKIVQEFQAQNPDIEVKLELTPWDGYYDKLLAALAAGATYDVYQLGEVDIGRYVFAGFAEPLSRFAKADRTDLSGLSRAVLRAYTVGGDLYGLPKDYAPYGVFYNTRLFDQAGLTYPKMGWTWDDLEAMAKKINQYDAAGRRWTRQGYAQWWGTAETHVFVTSFGGSLMAPDKEQFSGYLDSTATTKALQLMVDLRNKDKLYQENWPFEQGKVGMYLDASFRANQCRNVRMKGYATVLPPVGTQQGGCMYSSGFLMSRASKAKAAAWQVIKFVGGPRGNLLTAQSIATVPCWQSAVKELKFDTDPIMAPLIEAGEYAVLPCPANHPFYQKILGKYVYDQFNAQCFLTPTKSVPQFLAEVAPVCDREYASELKRKTHSVK